MKSWLLLLVVAACNHQTPAKQAEAPVGKAPQNVRCAEIADRIVARMSEGAPDGDKEAYNQRFRDLYARRCAADGWSDEARRCFLAAGKNDDDCEEMLTIKQRNMVECVDDAASTSGRPPATAEARAAVEAACLKE
jgi:hypothetical protein